jgi:hypothetical protein
MNKQRLAILVTAGVGLLATFLPWASIPLLGIDEYGAEGDGWFTFAIFLVPVILSLQNDRTKALQGGKLRTAMIVGIIAIIIGIWDMSSVSEEYEDVVSIGIGLYLVILAGIALAIIPFLFKEKDTAEK